MKYVLTLQVFQFHKGTIKTTAADDSGSQSCRFNSIKVRLRHTNYKAELARYVFQFHKGTIKTRCAEGGIGLAVTVLRKQRYKNFAINLCRCMEICFFQACDKFFVHQCFSMSKSVFVQMLEFNQSTQLALRQLASTARRPNAAVLYRSQNR